MVFRSQELSNCRITSFADNPPTSYVCARPKQPAPLLLICYAFFSIHHTYHSVFRSFAAEVTDIYPRPKRHPAWVAFSSLWFPPCGSWVMKNECIVQGFHHQWLNSSREMMPMVAPRSRYYSCYTHAICPIVPMLLLLLLALPLPAVLSSIHCSE